MPCMRAQPAEPAARRKLLGGGDGQITAQISDGLRELLLHPAASILQLVGRLHPTEPH